MYPLFIRKYVNIEPYFGDDHGSYPTTCCIDTKRALKLTD